MKLYYYKDPVGNFGDDINPWLWYELAPELFDQDDSELLVGVGTLINSLVPKQAKKLVFGSGVGYDTLPPIDNSWHFYCVRGPLSAERLGLDRALGLSDPAVLLTQVMPAAPVARTAMVSFMPHHGSIHNADWREVCRLAGINYIDPATDVHEVVFQIRQSRLVIAEAMHGAIVADAFRVPWAPVACYDHILEFKWSDWCQSLGMTYKPLQIPRLWDLEKLLSERDRFKTGIKRSLLKAGIWSDSWGKPVPEKSAQSEVDAVVAMLRSIAANSTNACLSDDSAHARSIAQLMDKVEEVKRDHRQGRRKAA